MPRKKQSTESTDVRDYMKSLRRDVDRRLTDLKVEMDEVQKKAAKTVQEQPVLALGIVFMVGIAVGIMLANTGD